MERSIRAIQPADGMEVLDMCRRMHAESPRYREKPFSEVKALGLISLLIAQGGGFVAEETHQWRYSSVSKLIGMVGGIVTEHFFSSEKFSVDMVLYVDPDYRGTPLVIRLAKAYEDWAIAQGAQEIGLGVSTGVEQERTVCIYERMGYKLASYTLIKTKD